MTAARQQEQRHPRGVGRAWADLPLRAKGELLDAVAAERQAAIAAG
jgi:hypothetical protein